MTKPLVRPTHVVRNLPLRYQWEFTRRHPAYIVQSEMFWRYRGATTDIDLKTREQMVRNTRVMLRFLLGVVADPPPAGKSFDEINDRFSISSHWLSGAIQPITMRSCVIALLSLPDDTKQRVISVLTDSIGGVPEGIGAQVDLDGIRDEALDTIVDPSVIAISVHSPLSAVRDAVSELHRSERERLGIDDRRRRDDGLDDKLRVWDLREGWTSDGYDVNREQGFKDIATTITTSGSTAADRYYGAFELVTGHPYSFENWVRVFSAVKLFERVKAEVLRRRHRRDAVSSIGDESILATTDAVVDESIPPDLSPELIGADSASLMTGIQELLVGGHTDEQIREALDVKDDKLVKYLRDHMPARPSSD